MRRALALVAAVAAALVLTPIGAAQAADDPPAADSVVLTVTDVAPNTPVASTKDRPLTFSLTVQNTTGRDLTGLSIAGAKWPLDAVQVPFGSSLTISNEARGRLEITLGSGRALLLAHPYP